MSQNLVTQDGNESLAKLLKTDAYANRFKQVLGDRAPQFVSSLIAVGNSMPDVEPRSIIGSAMTAACLDLPIDKNLGFAWIVPYREGGGRPVATFQMGYKAYVQLGLRSAQYERLNATPINREVFKGWDSIGEPVLDWEQYDPEKEIWGYFFGFKLVNGFTKSAVWTKEKVHEHAKKYSRAYRKGAAIWKDQFDGMALKTVIANTLRKWGPMSVQMQTALTADQALIRDVDATPEYIDDAANETGLLEKPGDNPEKTKQQEKQTETAKTKKEVKTTPAETKAPPTETKTEAVKDEKAEADMGLAPEQPKPEPEKKPEPKAEPKAENVIEMPTEPKQEQTVSPQAQLQHLLESEGVGFDAFTNWAAGKFLPKRENPSFPASWEQIPADKATAFIKSIKGVIAAIKQGLAKKA